MSYPTNIDDIPEKQLQDEIRLRFARREAGRCDYCDRPQGSEPPCKHRDRHKILEAIDSDGNTVTEGDMIWSSYGIPPVKIEGGVIRVDGELVVLTPGHTPEMATLKEFSKHMGDWWKVEDDEE